MSEKFEKNPLKTVREVDYFVHTLLCQMAVKNEKVKRCYPVKINSSSIKYPNAHLHYVHNKNARIQKDPLKTTRGVYYAMQKLPRNAVILS